MPTLDRDGVSIRYDIHGQPTDRPPLLLSHGYAATSAMWNPNLDALTADRQVITWDLRGHGNSDSPPDPAQYAETFALSDMAAILDAAGARTALIGGLSLGGYISLAFTLAHPERTTALLLFDTGPGYNDDKARAQWNEFAAKRAAELDAKGLAALGGSAEVAAAQHRSAAGLANSARGLLTQFDPHVIHGLKSVPVPTLVLVGADDTRFLLAAKYMADYIPDSTKVVVPDAGHAANMDQPAAFNQAVLNFLAKVEAA